MIVLVAAAWAGACCGTGGPEPTVLGPSERAATAVGLAGEVDLGAWSWDGRHVPADDDGKAALLPSVALLVRATPWLQAGARLPARLQWEWVDGDGETTPGTDGVEAWARLETPPGALPSGLSLAARAGVRSPGWPENLGVTVLPGVTAVGQRGPARARLDGWAELPTAAAPRVGTMASGEWVVNAGLALGGLATARFDLPSTAGGLAVPGGFDLRLGVAADLRFGQRDRVSLVGMGPLPVDGTGRNRPAQVAGGVTWTRVLAVDPDG